MGERKRNQALHSSPLSIDLGPGGGGGGKRTPSREEKEEEEEQKLIICSAPLEFVIRPGMKGREGDPARR